MAVEKVIRGKHDDAKHDGLVSNIRRELNAEDELLEGIEESLEEGVIFTRLSGKKSRRSQNQIQLGTPPS